MEWGRKRIGTDMQARGELPFAALRWGIAAASLLFALSPIFISSARAVPEEEARAAVSAFCREHGSVADALGISDFFTEDATPTGAFGTRPTERYEADRAQSLTFAEYMRDAWNTLLGREDG